MSRLEIRLLGGFAIRWGERLVSGFESQKVRALLVYLACHLDAATSREKLAGLLWPDEEPETARKNLRQALYNLRTTLSRHRPGAPEPLLATHEAIQLNPDLHCWLDVGEFEQASRLGWPEGRELDPDQLSHAAQLYRGDLLPGFFVKDSPAFEGWLIAQQERLRENAVQVFQKLVEYHMLRGEYRLALAHARRLVEIDPLSEKAHRDLMRLYALSSRRSAALAQYRHLRSVLEHELGVEPLAETAALHDAILAEELTSDSAAPAEDETPVPFVPLVGRSEPYRRLRESWEAARHGEVRLALVEGEAGIGKTRLIKSFVHHATSQRRAVVLQGRSYDLSPPVPLLLFTELLRNATESEIHKGEKAPEEAFDGLPEEILRLLPEASGGATRERRPAPPLADQEPLFTAVARFLRDLLPGGRGEADPMILLLDDLQWADRSSLELLRFLLDRFSGRPLWIVASWQPGARDRRHPTMQFLERLQPVDRIGLRPLDESDIKGVVSALLAPGQVAELADFMAARSGGLPLAITETINALCDAGLQVPGGGGRWRLTAKLEGSQLFDAATLEELILWRVRRLPTSIARLLTMASVIGHRFDSDLLEKAANEHPAVVETALQTLLDRWLIRHSPHYWEEPARRSDRSLWADGVRGGIFEFAHPWIRETVYRSINPLRRQTMHKRTAEVLEELFAGREAQRCEAIAHHFTLAGEWARALPYLKMAAARSLSLLAEDSQRFYQEQALEVLRHLEKASLSRAEKQKWQSERAVLLAPPPEAG